MLRCKDVAELVASDALRNRSPLRRFGVLMHLAMCRHCRGYVRQLKRIGRAARRLFGDVAPDADTAERIARAVREAARRAQPASAPEDS
jgi:hypothetical protein